MRTRMQDGQSETGSVSIRSHKRSSGARRKSEAGESSLVAPGRSPRTSQLAAKLGEKRTSATLSDVATAAVEGKSGGEPVQSDVARRVGSHLGADFSGVHVHGDPLAREASAAMEARAFAHGNDIFLGPGESGSDMGLMAHELTHVVQQGAAARTLPQGKTEVGPTDSPAEKEADAVADAVTNGDKPAALIADGQPAAGQMEKSAFLAELRAAITAAANEELGPVWLVLGCPYIERYFAKYADMSAAQVERTLRKYAPQAASATSASVYIPIVTARVRVGVREWVSTGELPPDVAAAAPGAVSAARDAAAPEQAARKPAEPGSPMAFRAALGPGQSLDQSVATWAGDAYGESFADVRVHTGAIGHRLAAEHDAAAVTVGTDVVLASGAYQPGTLEGDALLAHELAHVAQQRGATEDTKARRKKKGGDSEELELDADQAAEGALAKASKNSVLRSLAQNARTALKSGFELARCPPASNAAKKKAAEKAAGKLLGQVSAMKEADMLAHVGGMSATETRDLLDNVSAADEAKYKSLLAKIKTERLVGTAEALKGKLYWAGGSGPDSSKGYVIKDSTTRPRDDWATSSANETNTNEFALWIRGGAAPSDTSKMNCWEAVFYSGWKAGVISKSWLVKLHTKAAASGSAAGYFAVLEGAMGMGAAKTWVPGKPPPRGELVYFDGLAHVALSRGSKTAAGKSEIMSLWILPKGSPNKFNSTFQATTIEDIRDGMTALPGLGTPSTIKHGPNPW